MDQIRPLFQECFESAAKIAKGEATGRISIEIFDGQSIEFGLPKHGLQSAVIVVKTIDQSKPVLAIVDFDAVETGQSIVGLDEFGDHVGGGAAIDPGLLHLAAGAQSAHDRRPGATLQFTEFGVSLTLRFHPKP